jgi:hypothetical protein
MYIYLYFIGGEGDSLIPIEGAMYDIITVEQGGGILGGM